MLGVKLEDQQALDRTAETLSVPGLAFAEHGPRDLGLSYGYLEGRADPPLPPEVVAAGDMVLELTKERGMLFLDNVLPENVAGQIDRGVMIGAGRREDSAEVGKGVRGPYHAVVAPPSAAARSARKSRSLRVSPRARGTRDIDMAKTRSPDAPDPLAVAMGRIEAASALAATVLPDLVRHYEMGFVGAAYTVAHECTELVLKLHLDSLGVKYPTFGRDGHDLPKLFELWGDDRENAEVAYQRWVVGSTVSSRLAEAIETTLGLKRYPYMSEDERPSTEEVNRKSREMQEAILREEDPPVAVVLHRIDALIGSKDVRTLCIPARKEQFAEARYPANVWYPEKLLELQWKELVQATGESKSLGIVRSFLEKEGTPDVYSAWKYLHEGNLPKVGHQFRGPAIKMIVIAKQLRAFASGERGN